MRTLLGDGERATHRDRLCRALDLSGAACAILFALPLIVLLSVLVACDGPGPVIVRHRHARKDGAHLDLLKFRTQRVARVVENNRKDVGSRLSNFGMILRTTGLDELPALINVFTGELPICGHYTWRQVIAWLSCPGALDQ